MLVVVGLSHKSAPLEVRERLAMAREAIPEVLGRLTASGTIGEAVILSTCNRVEVYASPRVHGLELHRAIDEVVSVLASIGTEAVRPHLVHAEGARAVLHLFRVAASLDSLVIGEPQILGQLKDAIEVARETRALGPTLSKAMHRAVHVGKRVRTETAIGAGQVSVSSVAVDLARQIFGDLGAHTALLVGAGEMAESAAKLLVRAGGKLLVVNRSPERAAALVRDVGGAARPWSDLERSLVEADIVVASTSSPTPVLTRDMVKRALKARKGRSLFFIDIAVPRDVDPAVNDLENVFLYDVDDLSQIVAESREGRAAEATRAEAIVSEEARGFEAWARERAMAPTISGLRTRTRAVLVAEVERSLAGRLKHLSPSDRDALGMMIEAATNKLLHAPVTRLKALSGDPRVGDYADALRELFDLPENEADPGDDAPRASRSDAPRSSLDGVREPRAEAAAAMRIGAVLDEGPGSPGRALRR